MNAITHNDESYEFTTTEELLATPLVRRFTSDPKFTHLAHGDGCLVAYDRTPIMHMVGRLQGPVVLPKTLNSREGVQ